MAEQDIDQWMPIHFGSQRSRLVVPNQRRRTTRIPVRRSDYEVQLLPGYFLLPPLRGEVNWTLYAPFERFCEFVTVAQKDILLGRLGEPIVLERFLTALIGRKLQHEKEVRSHTTYKPTVVALMLTSACQLRCTYCYAEAGSTPKQNLSLEKARRAINLVIANAAERGATVAGIHIHGAGEPTLRAAAIHELLDYANAEAESRGLRLNSLMSTNFCVPESDAILYATRLSTVHVSCDGPPDVMSITRPAHSKALSSGLALEKALKAVQKAGLARKIVIRCTVTGHTAHRQDELVRYFHSFGIPAVYLVPVSGLGRGQGVEPVDPGEFIQGYRNALLAARELGMIVRYPGTELSRLRQDGFACGIGGDNFVVLPDGDISLCYEAVVPESLQRDYFSIGTIGERKAEVRISQDRISAIREEMHVKRRSPCERCFCRATCAGQCAARNFSDGEEVRDLGMTEACDITRSLTRLAVRDTL